MNYVAMPAQFRAQITNLLNHNYRDFEPALSQDLRPARNPSVRRSRQSAVVSEMKVRLPRVCSKFCCYHCEQSDSLPERFSFNLFWGMTEEYLVHNWSSLGERQNHKKCAF